jgi:hypothetical protein
MTSKTLAALTIVLVTAFPVASAAQGTSGSQFLGVGVGARAAGMGGAYAAVADDGTALYWNPAGLTRADWPKLTLSHTMWLSDASYQYAAYAAPLGASSAFGIALEQGSVSWDNTGEGSYEAGDFAGVVGYGRRLGDNLGVGAGLKFLSSSLGEDGASSYAVDVGAVYRLSESLRLGAAARNIGPGLTFVDETDPLPATLVVGGSYELGVLLLSADLEKVNDLSSTTRLGVEFSPVQSLALRGGWVSGDETALSSVTGGIGVNWKERWAFDYAYRGSELGDTHQFALSAGLGAGVGGAPATPASGGEEVMLTTAVPRTNLEVLSDLIKEVVGEAVTKMNLPEGANVYLRQIDTSDASWLVKSILLEELTSRGHVVRTGQMASIPAAAADEDSPPVYEIAYRIVDCETTLPRSWREWVVGARKDIRFELSDSSDSIVWAGGVQRERREIIPGSRVGDLASPGQPFASPEVEPGGLDKFFEPVIVAGIVGGLIYLFYTSRSTE